ncbi:MAG: protein containing prepilin-type N- cleavage/methylation domain protein [Sulfurimonas sp.]|nr:MAG: protein containing prepilin-type N- cleavage/methylation domain protein [Sulfurimonas sp.]
MKKHNAFTMIELVFVIVIMGIIGKFGLEFIAQAYNNYLFSSINNTLQSNSATALEFISARLQNRIKYSTIDRNTSNPNNANNYNAIQVGGGVDYTMLEWVATDMDGFRGNSLDTEAVNFPNWSGIIDVNNTAAGISLLISPKTNTTKINNLIQILSNSNSDINDSALYFIGSDQDIDAYGWDGVPIANQNSVMHPIISTAQVNQFAPLVGTWAGVDVYEYYKLSWTANAVRFIDNPDYAISRRGSLWFYYDYRPWLGEQWSDATTKSALIMQNVTTFRFVAIGSMIKIQVCVGSDFIAAEDYSICKEKTIY